MYRRIVRGLAAVALGAVPLGAASVALTAPAVAVTASQSSVSAAQHPALAATSTEHPTATDPPSRDNTDHPKKNPLDTGQGHHGEPRFKDWWDYL
jgi:hypothetical protein